MAVGLPLLRQAPRRMLHRDGPAAMIVVSVALLAGLVSAGPLFGSATAYGTLVRKLATVPAADVPGRRPEIQLSADDPDPASEPKMQALIEAIPYLGPSRATLVANSWQTERESKVTPYVMVGGVRLPALLYARTGILAGLQVASGTPGASGLWLPESTAEDLGVSAGSSVLVGKTYRWSSPYCGAPFFEVAGPVKGTDTEARVAVAGTYRTLPNGRTPLGPYFSRIRSGLPSDPGHCQLPGLLLIGDLPTISTTLTAVKEKPLWTASAELSPAGRTPDHLRRAAAGAETLRLEAADPDNPTFRRTGLTYAGFSVQTGLPEIQRRAAADALAARQQGRGISYAGGVLGLAALVLALRALAQRRVRETELLLGLGTPMRVVVGAGVLELLVPVVVGALAGLLVAVAVFSRAGPHAGVDGPAAVSAGLATAAVVVLALLSNAAIAIAQAYRVSRRLSGLPESRWGSQWLPMLTGATVLAVFATVSQDQGRSFQDPLAALLPILVLACGCAVLVRAVGAVGGWLRRPGRAGPSSVDRLVLRGLRGTGVVVSDLVIVLSIGIGVLAYGLIASAAVNQAVTDKAAVLAGAPTTAHVRHSWLLGGGDGPSPRLPAGTTVVWRASGYVDQVDRPYDVLVVNPPALRAAAAWGSGPELAQARAALADFGDPGPVEPNEDGGQPAPVPALLVGPPDREVGATATVQADLVQQPIEVRHRLAAFPGVVRPTVVLDARSFFPGVKREFDPSYHATSLDNYDVESNFVASVWTQQSLTSLRGWMLDRGVPVQETATLAQARATPVLLSSRWAASYQLVLGLVAALLAGLALVVAVDRRVARAAPVDLMLGRFGVSRSRLLRLRAVELAGTGLAALLVGAGPLAVMVALMPRLIEPDTALPPPLPVPVTLLPLLISAGVAIVITVIAVLAAARRSASLQSGEVLRDDT